MTQTAKLFTNGRSQAVRLPVEFRFEGDEVYITKDETTGDVTLSAKPTSWAGFFEAVDNMSEEDKADFLTDRDNHIEPEKDLF